MTRNVAQNPPCVAHDHDAGRFDRTSDDIPCRGVHRVCDIDLARGCCRCSHRIILGWSCQDSFLYTDVTRNDGSVPCIVCSGAAEDGVLTTNSLL
jgi:hypothetical protein